MNLESKEKSDWERKKERVLQKLKNKGEEFLEKNQQKLRKIEEDQADKNRKWIIIDTKDVYEGNIR